MTENELSKIIIGAAIEVHQILGPGLLESVYQKALAYELAKLRGLSVTTEQPVDVFYKGQDLEQGFRTDIVVENKVIIELKSVEIVKPVHKKQLLTYLRTTEHKLGLLINFNEVLLKQGITRIVNNL